MKEIHYKQQIERGLLVLSVLQTLTNGKAYVAEILQMLNKSKTFATKEGALYPLLSRLKREGFVEYSWVESESGPPRKYYELTKQGKTMAKELNTHILDLHKELKLIGRKKKMKSVSQVSLGGMVINLEDDASAKVETYLKKQAKKLKDNPDKDEIISDIEMSIAGKLRSIGIKDDMAATSNHIKDILTELGDVEDAKDEEEKDEAKEPSDDWRQWFRKPLTRSRDDRMIFGIAGSIAQQLNIATIWVRLTMVILTFMTDGLFFMIYLIVGVLTSSSDNIQARSAAESVEAHDQKKTEQPAARTFKAINRLIKFVVATVIGSVFIASLIALTVAIVTMASSSGTDMPFIGFDRSVTSYILVGSSLGLLVWLFGSSLYGIIRSSQNNPIKTTPLRQIIQLTVAIILISSSVSTIVMNKDIIQDWQERNPGSSYNIFDDDSSFCSDERVICAGGELLQINFE